MNGKWISSQAGKYTDSKIKSTDGVRKCDKEKIQQI